MPTDPEWYQDQLLRKGADLDCPACGEHRWNMSGRVLLTTLDAETSEVTPNLGVETIASACGYCGFVRLHAAPILFDEEAR